MSQEPSKENTRNALRSGICTGPVQRSVIQSTHQAFPRGSAPRLWDFNTYEPQQPEHCTGCPASIIKLGAGFTDGKGPGALNSPNQSGAPRGKLQVPGCPTHTVRGRPAAPQSSPRTGVSWVPEEPRLDVLINNAGIFQCPYMKTEDGFEMQFGVNHLGHFLLTNLLLGLLKSSAPSRIVVVSSKLYKYGDINFDDLNSEQSYNKSFCYSRSKLANILFTRELARRLEGTNVTVNVLHPGIVRTNLGRHIHIPLLVRPLFNLVSWAFFKTPVEGAQTSIYLASSPEVEGVSGRYFGDCKEEELLPKAVDESVARKLWDISEVMVGLLK
ncbi:PREDICTED: retinol dehydrogenase 14 isoform X2 [Rhinopithecus bieti]|uniref:retinol dehydrogenase 14 isoform X2 n=1 Tax=Rhinopithecus bieti TaxID=61621 RepID=UPI00083C4097|nr:PREDICTED: retinol dehydrogenase 14 isoform X2 [Rhinopithecus bieti]